MDFGLRPQDLAEIIGLIRQFSDIEETVIFGSRAKGNYKKGSDIDIAIKGEKSAVRILSHLPIFSTKNRSFLIILILFIMMRLRRRH